MDICLICLRTGKKLSVVDTRLFEFHDELCEYALAFTVEPVYCSECEHLLRKMYNFRAKCCKANNILQHYKKSKTVHKDLLYTLMPPTTLGTWDQRNTGKFDFVYNEKSQPLLIINKGKIQRVPEKEIKAKLEMGIEVLNKSDSSKEETEIILKYTNKSDSSEEKTEIIVENTNKSDSSEEETEINLETINKNALEYSDPMRESEIRIEDVHNDIKENLRSHTVLRKLEINYESDLETHNDDLERHYGTHNMFDKLENGVKSGDTTDDNLEEINNIKSDDSEYIPDDANLNSADSCDLYDSILNDKVNIRKRKITEELNTVVIKKDNETKMNDIVLNGNISTNSSGSIKKSLSELTNISLNDKIMINDKSFKNDNFNSCKITIIEQPKAKRKCTRRKMFRVKKEITSRAMRIYSKENLRANLLRKFDSCEELTTEDGTVIDQQYILDAVDSEENLKVLWELWSIVKYESTLSSKALSLLETIQNKDNEYKTVFDIQYLNTMEKIMEEFEKRKTYEYYVKAEFVCDDCHRSFRSKLETACHMMMMHDEKAGDYICPICKVRKKSNSLLKTHLVQHKTVFMCKKCPLVTNYRTTMMNHFNQHQGVQYKCDVCDATYKSRSALNGHVSYHCKLAKPRVCSLCARAFRHHVGLRQHVNIKHQNEPPADESLKVKCSMCPLTLISQAVYERHMWVSHQLKIFGMTPNDPCRKTNLLESFGIVEPARPKKPAPYKYKPALEKKPRKMFTCRVCNVKGTTHGWLSSHIDSEHPTVDMSVLYADTLTNLCDYCGKGYMTSAMLHMHLMKHTGAERTFECEHCDKRFLTKNALRCHIERHGPPRWPCTICGKKFWSSSNCYNHIRTHIGERRHKCGVCGKAFLHNTALKEHVRGVHYQIRRVYKREIITHPSFRNKRTCKEELRYSD